MIGALLSFWMLGAFLSTFTVTGAACLFLILYNAFLFLLCCFFMNILVVLVGVVGMLDGSNWLRSWLDSSDRLRSWLDSGISSCSLSSVDMGVSFKFRFLLFGVFISVFLGVANVSVIWLLTGFVSVQAPMFSTLLRSGMSERVMSASSGIRAMSASSSALVRISAVAGLW